MKPTKLSDVARAAGVSLGTASNVFNRPEVVRPAVREQVLAVARELGYSGPDPKGRLLMGGRANAIGLIPPGQISVTAAFDVPYFTDFAGGIAEVCEENGASVLLISGAQDRKEWAIRNALVDGFVLGHESEVAMVAARQNRVPCVVMDMEAGEGASSVRIEGYRGARLAVEHLLALGHRRFAVLAMMRTRIPAVLHQRAQMPSLTAAYPLDREKLEGYRDGLADAGIPFETVTVVQSFNTAAEMQDATDLLLDHLDGATAILCMSDRLAVALLTQAQRRGVRVPDEVSVIGFDDAYAARTSSPPLTTVSQDVLEKGRIAARILFSGESRSVTLPVRLVERSSTGVAPTRERKSHASPAPAACS
jgi:DNA-binding LacI/PurR family transcriptional regulator